MCWRAVLARMRLSAAFVDTAWTRDFGRTGKWCRLKDSASAEAKVNAEPARRRTAAQSMPTKRKTGTVAKSESGSKRSAKAKRKVGSVRRSKG